MIILFHYIYIYFSKYVREQRRKLFLKDLIENRRYIECEVNKHSSASLDAELNVKFDPPVYKQRYEAVQRILVDERWRSSIRKIVDFGCAEFGLFLFLRRLHGIQEILEVDIDVNLLEDNKFKVHPLNSDYFIRRPEPLTVKICVGSISDPDPILLNTDVVIAVEIIEHLYPDVLEGVPYNVFSFIRPKVAVFTTPNADFNVMFPSMECFRHSDHKFEWSREQFESWALNIATRFSEYEVYFSGIGKGPSGTESLGHCTQMAVFIRRDCLNTTSKNITPAFIHKEHKTIYTNQIVPSRTPVTENYPCGDFLPQQNYGICTYFSYSHQIISYELTGMSKLPGVYYKVLDTVEYPFDEDPITPEEKMLYEVQYNVTTLGRVYGRFYNEEKDRSEVPLEELICNSNGLFITEKELGSILEKSGYIVEECISNNSDKPIPCVIYEPVMENSTPTASDFSEPDDNGASEDACDSDWDLKVCTPQRKSSNPSPDCVNIIPVEASYQRAEILAADPIGIAEIVGSCLDVTDASNLENGVIEKVISPKKFNYINVKQKPFENISKIDINDIRDHLSKTTKSEVAFSMKEQDVNNKTASLSKRVDSKEPVAGSSNVKKKKKPKKPDEEALIEDMETIAKCIVANSLNIVDDVQDIAEEQVAEVIEEVADIIIEDVADGAVENGDLANNNRDMEGNNYAAEAADVEMENEENNANENVEVPNNEQPEVNQDFQNRNNAAPPQPQPLPGIDPEASSDEDQDAELAVASREVLFDPNSQEDLLEDFEIPPPPACLDSSPPSQEESLPPHFVLPQNVVLIGINILNDENEEVAVRPDAFPNWLLQLLGADVVEDPNQHDEPHFYCQGDGVGVHPSIIEVDMDEPTSESDSSADEAEATPTFSEQEVGSLPEDSSEHTAQNSTAGSYLRINGTNGSVNESFEEFYDTVDDADDAE